MTNNRVANTATSGSLVERAASTRRRLVVPTDAGDPSLARARRAALEIARRFDLEVVLYDRSHERWTDHPHPKGPLTVDQIDGEERPHLVRQLRDFDAGGVTARAFLATVPALTAMIDLLQELEVDAVMVPTDLSKPTVMDRLQVGSSPAEMIERIAALQLDVHPLVFVVDDDGVVDLADGQRADLVTNRLDGEENRVVGDG